MDRVEKFCDADVTRRGTVQKCHKPVPNNEPTTFAMHSRVYEVDLCEDHILALETAVEPYALLGRPTRQMRATTLNGRAVMRGKKGGTFTTKDVRAWLQARGQDVQDTGRISNDLIEQYRKAHV